MKVSIFGMGYVGVVSGACLTRMGHHVVGVDISADKVRLLRSGVSPIIETSVNEMIAASVKDGSLSVTTDVADAVARTDVSFISVGTPSARDGSAMLGAIDTVSDEIGAAIGGKSTPHVVAVRSTVPPGTIEERVAPRLVRHSGRSLGEGLEVCSNPEFLREGSAVRDFEKPAFTLIGAGGEAGFSTLESLYSGTGAPVIRTPIRTAESIKYLCNIFHAVKIGFANEIGAVLKAVGVDSREAMRIFCEDRVLNISPAYLRPGFAFGGSCLPKDLRGFLAIAQAHGVDLPFIGNLIESNARHIGRAFDMITRGGRRKVAMFGLAFKPGTDDLRESPLVVLAERLIGKGYELAIFDRHVDVARLIGANREFIDREIPHLERMLRPTPEDTLDGAGVIVIGHASPAEVTAIGALHRGRTIVDLQGVKDLEALEGADYQGICW
jgi:GDP-mannose 6-dehydrogenase